MHVTWQGLQPTFYLPRIDALADEGLLFENAFSQCSLTDTSVASLFTSLYPGTHKMFRSTDWLHEASLIDRFRKAGFNTAAFSANVLIAPEYHFDYGFDYFEEIPYARATLVFNQVIRRLEKNTGKGGKHFFYIHLIDPHDMYYAPKPFFDMFDPGRPLRMTAFMLSNNLNLGFASTGKVDPACDYNPFAEKWDDPELTIRCLSLLDTLNDFTMRDLDNMIARYDGEIRYADTRVGRFVDYLDEHGIAADARFVLKYITEQRKTGKPGARKLLFELFPYGYVKQACKMAGMRQPRAWSTG